MRQLGECGEYRIGRLRVVCFHFRSSEVGSPHLCQLRINRMAPVNKIEMCIDAYGSYGDPTNVVASTVTELDDTPPYFMDDIGILWGPPMDARRGIY
jgi:hypothetical protein